MYSILRDGVYVFMLCSFQYAHEMIPSYSCTGRVVFTVDFYVHRQIGHLTCISNEVIDIANF